MRQIALIGTPLAQSYSPAMQNAAYRAMGEDCLYSLCELRREDLPDFVARVRREDFAGFAVTHPYKVDILAFLDALDPLCAKIGACNTVVKTNGGRLIGYNTDALGFARALTQSGKTIAGGRFFCLGAGGAGRAICMALADGGAAEIFITDIHPDRAEALAREIAQRVRPAAAAVPYGDFSALPDCDTVINASGVGMGEKRGLLPLPTEAMAPSPFYFDACYNPEKTAFLQTAEANGSRIENGLSMMLYQGIAQIRLWTGREAPESVMREAVRRAISGGER